MENTQDLEVSLEQNDEVEFNLECQNLIYIYSLSFVSQKRHTSSNTWLTRLQILIEGNLMTLLAVEIVLMCLQQTFLLSVAYCFDM